MVVFAIRIEDALNVTVQRLHDAYSRKHRWAAAALGYEDQRLYRGLPFVAVGFLLRELGDVRRCISKGDELPAVR
jgi:hypothetical protein